jgi:ADP-ribose pyrophosphatase YjhB (NUDIX family)
MPTEPRFARFRRAPLTDYPGACEVPDNGMCLSTFVVLERPGRDGEVLLGRLEPTAPWWELGAIDPARLARIGERWMLPSRQLALFESPDDAARSILADQLGIDALELEGPLVFSDPADAPGRSGRDPHWDLHFVYRGRWSPAEPPQHPAWRSLAFVDVRRLGRDEIARGQRDVLELAEVVPPFGGGPSATGRTRGP